MKDIFGELEAEVDQNIVTRKHDDIERKNLLIANDNLIADCLSKEVFYIATNSKLTVSRFTKMHEAHTIVQSRCLELEAKLSKLQDKVQKDDHTELVKRFSNLEVTHLNLQYAIDVEPIPPHNRNNREVHLHYLKHLKESVETLREIVEEAKHAPTPVIKKKQVNFEEQCDTSNRNTHKHVEQLNTQKTNVLVPPSIGVNCCPNASGSQPRRNTKKNRISLAKGVNKKKVEEHLISMDMSKNHKKTVKNGKARTRESEEYKKKPRIQN
ncbi:hypothetical protein Tco_0714941 [Tanacetum coccineum]